MAHIDSVKGDFPFQIQDVVRLLGLRTVRPMGNRGIYTDCPFCGDKRGKLNINFEKDKFRCNYCDEAGGMLHLYAKVYGVSTSEAYHEIVEALNLGASAPGYTVPHPTPSEPPIQQSPPASARDVHETMTLLLELLTLSPRHENNLRGRGLDGKRIQQLGYKSTPLPEKCLQLTKTLLDMGCTVAGVPGFYQIEGDGQWTLNIEDFTSGMLAPVRGMDGLIRGMQIRLDKPFPKGGKYIWLSSSSAFNGITSGSHSHFVGSSYAKTVYVTEGCIKAEVAHFLMNRTFVSVPGANNLHDLEEMFEVLAKNGTQLVIEAMDMDKYRNQAVKRGASRIAEIARKKGMECRRLTWNPNFKGIDDWQLHLRNRVALADRLRKMSFKDRYLEGFCEVSALEAEIERWRRQPDKTKGMRGFLGLSADEYSALSRPGHLEVLLSAQRKRQMFRIYQLELSENEEVVPFAYADTSVMREKGKFEQPPASMYRLVYDAQLFCPVQADIKQMLARIKAKHSDEVPEDFCGRQLAPSDVIELYDKEERSYYYCNERSFEKVVFSPLLALPMKSSA